MSSNRYQEKETVESHDYLPIEGKWQYVKLEKQLSTSSNNVISYVDVNVDDKFFCFKDLFFLEMI